MAEGHVLFTHRRSQASDLLHAYLVLKYATEETHPGISKGLRIEPLTKDSCLRDTSGRLVVSAIESSGKKNRFSFCGRGGGMYDEHGKNILDCEATLVGKKLGLLWEPEPDEKVSEVQSFILRSRDGRRKKKFAVADPKMRDLFAVVARDDTGGSPPYSLGNLIDLMHWRYPDDQEKVTCWAFRLFDAIRENGPLPKEERKTIYRDTVEALIAMLNREGRYSSHNYHPQACEKLRMWLAKRIDNQQWEALDVIDASAIVFRDSGSYDWTYEALIAEFERQHHFHTVTAEEAKKARMIDVRILVKDGADERLEDRKIAVVESDDLDVHKYLSAADLGYYAICVIKKNSRGQVQIFPGNFTKKFKRGDKVKAQQVPYNFPMPYVAAAIRERELELRGLSILSWFELISDHGPVSDRTWFFYSSIGWLMNGSLTMTEVSPTIIPLSEIAVIVERGFDVSFSEFRTEHIEKMKARR